ncbi:MAG: CopY family transcriptional regulator [Acidobacteria bacterium]|nr:MAG: CopY family transcriptional regulator [Acidobacteriota bacterium]
MAARRKKHLPELSPLEAKVMEILWSAGEATADEVRQGLPADLTDSSVRTLLRRLEQKSYVTHERERKRFIFRAAVERPTAAAAVARRIVKSICGGAVESLLIGMVESRMLSRKELDAARKRLAQLESEARDD